MANFLIERGSPGVVVKKNEVQGYFAGGTKNSQIRRDVGRFLRGITDIYPGINHRALRWKVVKDKNWHSSWQKFFAPQKIGKAFWVTPPWTRPTSLQGRQVITIEPGMAFGTGTHATTRGCMELIEKVAHSLRRTGFIALDVGTGSGILAIALAKLGASKVWALDIDPVALKVARECVRQNAVQDRVELREAEPNSVRRSFPVVVANLTAETILELSSALEKRVSREGFLILSGILKSKASDVSRRFCSNGFRVMSSRRDREWATLLLKRN